MVTIISIVTFKYSDAHDSAFQAQLFHYEHHPLKINIYNTQHINTSNTEKCNQHKTDEI